MIWLVLISFALVAVWGTSERWDLAGARRRVTDSIAHRHHGDDPRRPR